MENETSVYWRCSFMNTYLVLWKLIFSKICLLLLLIRGRIRLFWILIQNKVYFTNKSKSIYKIRYNLIGLLFSHDKCLKFSHPLSAAISFESRINPLTTLWWDEITRKLDFRCAVYIFRMENSLIDSGCDEYVFVSRRRRLNECLVYPNPGG